MKKSVKITLLSIAGVLLICLIAAVVIYKLPTHVETKGMFYEVTGAQDALSSVEVEYSLETSYGIFGETVTHSRVKGPDGTEYLKNCADSSSGWFDKIQDGFSRKFGAPQSIGMLNKNGYDPFDQNSDSKSLLVYAAKEKIAVAVPTQEQSLHIYCGPADSEQEAQKIYQAYFNDLI